MDLTWLPDAWTAVGIVIAFVALAITLLTVPNLGKWEPRLAKLCLLVAFGIFSAKLIGWGITDITAVRLLAVWFLLGSLGVALVYCVKWVDLRSTPVVSITQLGKFPVETADADAQKATIISLQAEVKSFTSSLRIFADNQDQASRRVTDRRREAFRIIKSEEERHQLIWKENQEYSEVRALNQSQFNLNYRGTSYGLFDSLISSLKEPPYREETVIPRLVAREATISEVERYFRDRSSSRYQPNARDIADYLDMLSRILGR